MEAGKRKGKAAIETGPEGVLAENSTYNLGRPR